MQACAAGYASTYATTLKLQLVSWTVVGLTTAKFKPLCTSYAWLLLVQYHVYLDLHGLGLFVPVFCFIWLCSQTRKEF
jgi:hypothetical protein